MNASKKTRQTAKLTGFASGILFLFGVSFAVGGERGTAILALLTAFILFAMDIEFKEREADE